MMSKYDPLTVRLAGHDRSDWRATFAELEEVLGFPLPKAARAGRAWWKADAGAHARAWTEAGWTAADVDPAAGQVTFRRSRAAPDPVADLPATAGDEPPILKRLEVGPGWGVALVLGGVAVVAGIGALVFRGARRKT